MGMSDWIIVPIIAEYSTVEYDNIQAYVMAIISKKTRASFVMTAGALEKRRLQ
jgi:hypothetical protein